MLERYVQELYVPAASEFRRRIRGNAQLAKVLHDWELRLRRGWPQLHIGEPTVVAGGEVWNFSVPIYLGDLGVGDLRVELYADPEGDGPPAISLMQPRSPIPGTANGHIYAGTAATLRPAGEYTVRIRPDCQGVQVPAEISLILWQK
jgi:starch phosphorylase